MARRDVATNIPHYYFSDHLGTHAVVENATGTACEQDIDYYPYGGQENDYCTTPLPQNYKFNGKERDSESNLDNFGARYDASSLGRFMTPDWATKPTTVPYANFGNPQSLNLYSFVENNPTTVGDPDGHVPWGFGGLGSDCPTANCQNLMHNFQLQIAVAAEHAAQSQQSNRQPDGSYKATPAQLAKIQEAADKKTTIGNGECVTACERFTGVPGPTSSWKGGNLHPSSPTKTKVPQLLLS